MFRNADSSSDDRQPGARTEQPDLALIAAARVFAATALVAASAGYVRAYDLQIDSFISEMLSLDDNVQTSESNARSVFGSTTQGGVTATARTPSMTYTFDVNLGLTIFKGLEDDEVNRNINNSYGFSFERSMRSVDISFRGGFSEVSTFFSEQDDTGQTGGDSKRLTYTTEGRVKYQLNATDDLALTGNFSTTDFSDADATSDLTAFESWGVGTEFTRQVNRTLSASLSARSDRFSPIGSTGNTRYAITGSIQKKLTPTIQVGGSTGVRYTVGGQDDEDDDGGDGFGYPITMDASYTGKDTTANLGFSRQVSESASGKLQESTSVTLGAGYTVNTHLSTAIAASYIMRRDSGDDTRSSERTNITVSPTVAYALTQQLSLNLGYQFRSQEEEDGTGIANQVFMTLSHRFLPMP